MISVLQQPANHPVSPRKDSFQITGLRFMIIERDTLDMKLLRQMIMLGTKLFRPVLCCPLKRRVCFWYKIGDTDCHTEPAPSSAFQLKIQIHDV